MKSKCKWLVPPEDIETSFEKSTKPHKILCYTSDGAFYSFIEPMLDKIEAWIRSEDDYGVVWYIDAMCKNRMFAAYKEFYGKQAVLNP